MPDTPNKPTLIRFPDGTFGFDVPEPSPEETAKRKWISTKCGHVKRDLSRNKRLTGKTLEFALAVVGENSDIGEKLKAGEALTNYELHWVLDVELLHVRLGSRKLACPDHFVRWWSETMRSHIAPSACISRAPGSWPLG